MDKQIHEDILEVASFADGYLLLVILGIIIISGTLGGLASYYIGAQYRISDRLMIPKYSILGTAAALTMPLFLNMVSSDLLLTAHAEPLNLLVFTGLCVIFSAGTCLLVDNMTVRQPLKVKMITEKSPQAVHTEEGSPETVAADQPAREDKHLKGGISENDFKIMTLMREENNYFDRTLDELLKMSDLTNNEFNESLSLVMAKGLVGQKLTEGNNLLFSLTPKGRQILSRILDT
jgi:hypothetical protein